EDGVVTLEASGSPGAIVPAIERIQPLLRAAVPQVTAVHVVWPGQTRPAVPDADTVARIQRVIDEEVNPAVAAHGGRVTLVDACDTVAIRQELTRRLRCTTPAACRRSVSARLSTLRLDLPVAGRFIVARVREEAARWTKRSASVKSPGRPAWRRPRSVTTKRS